MFTTRSLLLKNQEVKKWLGKNHHKNCLVINLSQYLLWPAIVWKPLSCFDLQDLMIFSQTFPHKNKVRVFIPFYVSSVFNKNIVQSTREGVRYRVSQPGDWYLRRFDNQPAALSHGSWFFRLVLWRIFPVLAPVLTKFMLLQMQILCHASTVALHRLLQFWHWLHWNPIKDPVSENVEKTDLCNIFYHDNLWWVLIVQFLMLKYKSIKALRKHFCHGEDTSKHFIDVQGCQNWRTRWMAILVQPQTNVKGSPATDK